MRGRRSSAALLIAAGLLAPACAPDHSDSLADGLTEYRVRLDVVASGIEQPTDLAWRTGDPRLYVASKTGVVVPVTDGEVGTPVLDLTGEVSSGNEQGLLGLVFHPSQPYAYVDYTAVDGTTIVAEYPVGGDGRFDVAAARTVLTVPQPYEWHNGGDLAFGPDGRLYISLGDGGAANDPNRRALDTGELLGKILRIDPRPASDGGSYAIPDDNPFVGVEGARGEIWAYGLRNPWRFNFDPANGDLWIGDVGQDVWEEVDVARAADGGGRGVNFGWSAFEGTHRFHDDQPADGVTMPVYEYEHGDVGCSVAGGTVYRGDAVPLMAGWYVFGDWCAGRVYALPATTEPGDVIPAGGVVTLARPGPVSAVVAGPDGELLVLGFADGTVMRIVPA